VDVEEAPVETLSEELPAPPAALPVAGAPPVTARAGRFPPPALYVRTYRWYWLSQWPVLIGTWMQIVALGYLVYQVTGSTTAVAVVAAADGLPAVVLSLAGGVLADRFPRRRILLVTQSTLGVSAGALAVLASTGHASFAAIVVVAAIFGSADAMDLPTRQALIADLVDREMVVSAVALGSVAMSASRIVGPSLAGLLIAGIGPGVCFAVLALAYIGPIIVLLLVIPDIIPLPRRAGATAIGDMRDAVLMAFRHPLVRTVTICAAALSFFGVSYMPFLPVLAREQLHSGGQVLGLMYSTGGIGGLVAGLIISTFAHGAQRVRMLLGGGVVYTFGLLLLMHAPVVLVALPGLVAISFGFLAMNTSMTTLLQTETDPALRGRLLGIYTMIFAGFQPLGTLFYGAIAVRVPIFEAISVGALVVGATAVWAATRPALWRIGGATEVALT
jgi:MFS family permease